MGFAAKAIKKLGLSGPAYSLLSPFAADREALPTPEEALELLHSLHPDRGRSALRGAPLPETGAERDVDVIIPVYNAAPFLRECLDSVFRQEGVRFRVIAVDDGSTDGSGGILDAYDDARLTVIHQENRGLAGARNRGIDAGSAPYLYFLDADDLLAPDCLQALLRCARKQSADLVEGAFRAIREDGRDLRRSAHAEGPLPGGQAAFGFACGKLFRRELFSRLCFPEAYLFEDSVMAQLLFPLARAEGRVLYGIPDETFFYRQNPGGIVRASCGKRSGLDSLYVTLSLYRDRQALGLENDQLYYEYLLKMLALSYHRTEALGREVTRAVFSVFRDLLLRDFSDFSTERAAFRPLEQAVRGGDYGRCRLFCALH